MQTLLTKKPQETHSSQTKFAGSKSSTSAGGGLQESPGFPLFLQPKLAISQPDDPYEQEADRVAEQVMRMPDPASMRSSVDTARGIPVAIQRQCAACASGRQPCSACEEDESVAVSRKAQGAIGGDVPASVGSVLRSAGQPLAASSRAFFEPRFGQNLGQVRVHSDGAAQQSARDVNALAYTVGSHVVFGTGRYAPGTPNGQRLLAHELTHVLQQQPQLARQEQPLDHDPPAPQPQDAPQADKAGTAGATSVTSNCVPTGFSRADFLKNGGTTAEFGLTALTVSDATFPALDLVRKGKGVQVQATTAALPRTRRRQRLRSLPAGLVISRASRISR